MLTELHGEGGLLKFEQTPPLGPNFTARRMCSTNSASTLPVFRQISVSGSARGFYDQVVKPATRTLVAARLAERGIFDIPQSEEYLDSNTYTEYLLDKRDSLGRGPGRTRRFHVSSD